jgi:hypothetical protein
MAHFSRRQGRRWLLATNALAAAVVAFTLAVNLERGYPLISIAATVLIGAFLQYRWVRAGRPRGIESVERSAEAED